MVFRRHKPVKAGFTLIELLCVMGIISILMGLLLGPVSRVYQRARALRWEENAHRQLQSVIDQLKKHFRGRQDFAPVTLKHIEELQLVGPEQISFLKDKRVTFIPFAGMDPDDQVVIHVRLESGFLTEGGTLTEVKGRITNPPE